MVDISWSQSLEDGETSSFAVDNGWSRQGVRWSRRGVNSTHTSRGRWVTLGCEDVAWSSVRKVLHTLLLPPTALSSIRVASSPRPLASLRFISALVSTSSSCSSWQFSAFTCCRSCWCFVPSRWCTFPRCCCCWCCSPGLLCRGVSSASWLDLFWSMKHRDCRRRTTRRFNKGVAYSGISSWICNRARPRVWAQLIDNGKLL